jgi:hypothetical protein
VVIGKGKEESDAKKSEKRNGFLKENWAGDRCHQSSHCISDEDVSS